MMINVTKKKKKKKKQALHKTFLVKFYTYYSLKSK
jgi:hypothetical protein